MENALRYPGIALFALGAALMLAPIAGAMLGWRILGSDVNAGAVFLLALSGVAAPFAGLFVWFMGSSIERSRGVTIGSCALVTAVVAFFLFATTRGLFTQL